ncbi:winged helix-turn-helix transcriptional regulator [Raineyella fluvialis]|uniref:Winged helix-turn-helix transcriptional regulator n=1 Tax=Raineyella fluvialis TaxID=2662261 RepID=A0A5Q2FDP5_9ACTN|nr:winged helix-turn-helix transcriptional regulator [Raineyella fluvialis]
MSEAAVGKTGTGTRRAVYEFVREQGLATKKDIADGLGISLPTVAKYVRFFLDAGLLKKGAKLSSGSSGDATPSRTPVWRTAASPWGSTSPGTGSVAWWSTWSAGSSSPVGPGGSSSGRSRTSSSSGTRSRPPSRSPASTAASSSGSAWPSPA